MNSRQKFALLLLFFAITFILVSQTGWAANGLVFYGLIGIFMILNIALISFKLRQRSEHE